MTQPSARPRSLFPLPADPRFAMNPTQSPTDTDLDLEDDAPAAAAEPVAPHSRDNDDGDPLDRLRSRLGLRESPAEDSGDSEDAPRRAGPALQDRLVPLAPRRPTPADDFDEGDDDDEVLPETERFAPESAEDLSIDAGKAKVCRNCGRDLRGHRRYKDDRGYLCATCEKEDRLRRIACAECGKPTLPENLRPWGPISICARCLVDHENDPKSRVRRQISNKGFEMAERQNLLVVAGIALVLGLIVALAWLGVIGG